MRHQKTQALLKYWNKLRAGRAAPYRREVDPRAIEGLLDSTFILEHVDERNSRFRLAGTRLCENFGMELRGMSALALWHGDCREKARDVINHVVSDPCIGHIRCTVETRSGMLYDAEFLLLPMRCDYGDVSRILGCGYYMKSDGAAARITDPVHHWIDDTHLYAIDAVAPETAPFAQRPKAGRPTQERRAAKKDALSTLALLEDELRSRSERRSRLKTIDGGRRGGLPLSAAPSILADKPRDHLRLVK